MTFLPYAGNADQQKERVERVPPSFLEQVIFALSSNHGSRKQAAAMLNIKQSQLLYYLKKHDIDFKSKPAILKEKILSLHAQGLSNPKIAKELDITRVHVWKVLNGKYDK